MERVDLMDWIGVITAADPQARILLHGNSMGGAAVMMAAGEASLPRNVVAAIEDSGFTSVWDQFMFNARSLYHLPRWAARPLVATMSLICRRRAGYGFREASCVRQLHHTTIPMLFIHGGADDFVSPASLERNFDACASIDRQKMMIPGAGHTMAASTDPERYWRRVTNFVTRTFGL
nr:alpha/beta hydrolase [uncultured Bifidobacterium sp.]